MSELSFQRPGRLCASLPVTLHALFRWVLVESSIVNMARKDLVKAPVTPVSKQLCIVESFAVVRPC